MDFSIALTSFIKHFIEKVDIDLKDLFNIGLWLFINLSISRQNFRNSTFYSAILSVLILSFFISSNVEGMKNPAAVYCEEMGYSFKVEKNQNGETGVCIINEHTRFNAWEFFEGKVGKEYSFCFKNGYDIETARIKNPYSNYCAICVPKKDKEGKTPQETGVFQESIPMMELMKFGEKYQQAGNTIKNLTPTTNKRIFSNVTRSTQSSLPPHFDWRNRDEENWITPVKDQGLLESCTTFTAVGLVESKIKIESQNPSNIPDLSEQQLQSCGDYSETRYTWSALEYMVNEGIVDEDCFSYTASERPCILCNDWAERLTFIKSRDQL